jgi:hypothetical protein
VGIDDVAALGGNETGSRVVGPDNDLGSAADVA